MTTELHPSPDRAAAVRETELSPELTRIFVEEVPERIATLVEGYCCDDASGLLETIDGIRLEATRYGFREVAPLAEQLTATVSRGRPRQEIADDLKKLTDVMRQLRPRTGGTAR